MVIPGGAAVGAALLAWFIMQSRMEVALAWERENLAGQRERLAEQRGEMRAERSATETVMQAAIKAAEETARREAVDQVLADLRVEQRRFTREGGKFWKTGKCLVLQERMYFRGVPLSGWIEQEFALDGTEDIQSLAEGSSVFENGVVNIATIPRNTRALSAAGASPRPAVQM